MLRRHAKRFVGPILVAWFFLWNANSGSIAEVALERPLSTTALNTEQNERVTLERLDEFIKLATGYLVRVSHTAAQDPEFPGRFTYIAYLGEDLQREGFDTEPQEHYNLLRHNGAIYALALSYDRKPSLRVLDVMVRGLEYVKDQALKKIPDLQADDKTTLPELLAPWEGKKAKLGGAGLTLIAMCSVERILPGTTPIETMREIANFIRFLQKDDGSFYSRYFRTRGKDDSWTSLFYPGEAALGLIYLAEMETNPTYQQFWFEAATDALLYLERYRRNLDYRDIEQDHWALLASARLLPHLLEGPHPNEVAYWLIYRHAIRVIHTMLVPLTEEQLQQYNGCFTSNRGTCNTATLMEGLIASLSFVHENEIYIDEKGHKVRLLKDRMLYNIELGIGFLLDAQEMETTHDMQGGMPSIAQPKTLEEGEVRIDYVQHSLSAVMSYETYLKSGSQIPTKAPRIRMHGKISSKPLESSSDWSFIYFLVAAMIVVGVLVLTFPRGKSQRYNN